MSDAASMTAREDTIGKVRNLRAFDLWSQTYDTQSNPLLTLEKRYLERLLPCLAGRDVLDVGCGSGRWLAYLTEKQPQTLCGIDASEGMLRAAAERALPGVELVRCSCEETPFAQRTFDALLASFVLSYVDRLESFAQEMSRIARRNCDLFISDMHPQTQQQLGWKRTFEDAGNEVALDTVRHRVQDTVAAFTALGWELQTAIEPEFGAPEHEAFAVAGRLHRFHEAKGHAAIYLLHLRKKAVVATLPVNEMVISGARCALGAQESVSATLRIASGRIAAITSDKLTSPSHAPQIDLSGYLLLPGLVNAHDHLEFALFPRLAGSRYPNAAAWAMDIHQRYAEVIAQHKLVPKDVRFWWGGLRNLLCGVTTVCHHNPAEAEFKRDDFPVRVVREFGWAHSLAFGGDLRQARGATPAGSPFMVHACEGVDEEARNEILELDRIEVLDENTVLIHGLGIDEDGLALLRERRASLVICPSSNQFLFERAPQMSQLSRIERVALGSDSPLTALGDLLDEVRFAINFCDIPARTAYAMVTDDAARILCLKNSEGTIKASGAADIIAIRDTQSDAVDRLQMLSATDVELVMIKGQVQLASNAVLERLPQAAKDGLERLCVGGMIRWLRAPVGELLRKAEDILGSGAVRLGGQRISTPASAEARHAG